MGLLKTLKKAGFEITVIAPVDNFSSKLVAAGFRYIPIPLDRYSANPLSDLITLRKLISVYREIKPDFIFHYTIKPNIYGTLAASHLKIPSVAITTGLGSMVTVKNPITALYIKWAYRLVGKLAREIWFLNDADIAYFLDRKIVKKSKTRILPGEGIDTDEFKPIETPTPIPDGKIRFLFAGRLLKSKGFVEFVAAAKQIKKKHPNVVFDVLGFLEANNPDAFPVSLVTSLHRQNIVNYHGETQDIRPFIQKTDCIVLPSYREGISRILLEASSMAKPVITTDVAGCREIVKHRVSGILCQPKSAESLQNAMENFLALSPADRKTMGLAGRKKVKEEFSEKRIFDIYFRFLKNEFPQFMPKCNNQDLF